MTYYIETYGCQMNVAESAAYKRLLEERGWQEKLPQGETSHKREFDADTLPDMVMLNTCSVRATAEQRVFGRIAHYKALKKHAHCILVIAGCMAERIGESLITQGADYVFGPTHKELFSTILDSINGVPQEPLEGEALMPMEPDVPSAYLPIIHGCNNFCTYCIVPYVRGREKSRSPQSILAELRTMDQAGVREVSLLGQNVNSYQYEDTDFPKLLQMVANATANMENIKWVRFLSSHPKDLSSETIMVMAANPVFCRHIHLCVQHGSNRILQAMNRKYTRERFLALVAELRAAIPGVSISTDILVGFPGETEEDIAELLSLMEAVRFSESFMYHYNPREGTAAYKLPNRIPDEVKKERLERVITLQQKHTHDFLLSCLGSVENVLVESISRKNPNELLCRTEHDAHALISGQASLVGSFVTVKLETLAGKTLKGVV